jgi:hypothetical protein
MIKVLKKYWMMLFMTAACFSMWVVDPLLVLGVSTLVLVGGAFLGGYVCHYNSHHEKTKRARAKCERLGHDLPCMWPGTMGVKWRNDSLSCARCRELVPIAPDGCLRVWDDEWVEKSDA